MRAFNRSAHSFSILSIQNTYNFLYLVVAFVACTRHRSLHQLTELYYSFGDNGQSNILPTASCSNISASYA